MKVCSFQNKVRIVLVILTIFLQCITFAAAGLRKNRYWNEKNQIIGFSYNCDAHFREAIRYMEDENEAKIDELKMLIKMGVDINQADDYGQTPLTLAVIFNFIGTTRTLLEAGATVNYRIQSEDDFHESTALSIAAQKKNADMVELLLKWKADPNIADFRGFTPLIYAICTKNLEAAKQLAAVSDMNISTNRGITPLHFAVGDGEPTGIELIKILLAKGANINARTKYNDICGIHTPLSKAAEWGHRNNVEFLLEQGAIDNAEPSAAAIARRRGDESLALLIESYNTDRIIVE